MSRTKIDASRPSFDRDVISHGDGFWIRDASVSVDYDPHEDERRVRFSFDIYIQDRPNLLGLFRAVAFSTVTYLSRVFNVSPPTPEDLYGGPVPERKQSTKPVEHGFKLGRRKLDLDEGEET